MIRHTHTYLNMYNICIQLIFIFMQNLTVQVLEGSNNNYHSHGIGLAPSFGKAFGRAFLKQTKL